MTIPSTTQAAAFWQPVLIRALVAAAFGAITIFWQEPGRTVMAVAGGLFLLLSGGAVWLLARQPAAAAHRQLLLLQAAVLAVTGVLACVFQTVPMFTVLATAALLVSGGAELMLGWSNRPPGAAKGRPAAGAGPAAAPGSTSGADGAGSVLARDWLITGAVSVGFGIALPFFSYLGPHALLGVLGGAAIITAVVLLIAALSLRHDARQPTAG
ncbi:hypothetical protein [Arthrobacter sulfonylureivorans]|uniref:DUF308 domain-containing protein n=1 Tax=Arthrobacter sulfonylureivorans TaxID=2486855 RepID=A0ABY3WEK0_9MICC|nr:hypothetical protein [Arthrobacter sulfonylureivorans]UNK46114.1 hypothetical protein MNQ99_01690 [Arthrobacter sulfonylureivorans]